MCVGRKGKKSCAALNVPSEAGQGGKQDSLCPGKWGGRGDCGSFIYIREKWKGHEPMGNCSFKRREGEKVECRRPQLEQKEVTLVRFMRQTRATGTKGLKKHI